MFITLLYSAHNHFYFTCKISVFVLTFRLKRYIILFAFGPVAQLGERSVRIREVKGSNPSRSTKRALDEHLLFQRRFRHKGSDLMQNRKESQGLKPWLSFIYVLLCHHRLTVLPIFLLPFFKRFFAFFGFIILSYLRHKKPCE